jgi:signal transduction histidine kinase
MDRAELRRLDLFEGVSDAQLDELVGAGEEVAVEPGTTVFGEGEPAEFWWLLLEGQIDLIRHVGREDTVVARMDVPGRWAGGFRAWDAEGVYLATGRAHTAARLYRLTSTALRERSNAWFPFGGHLIEGLYRTARSIESTARQRSSLVTLGTLAAGLAHEINNPASAATRAVESLGGACDTLLASLGRLAEGGIDASQFSALDGLRIELASRTVDPDPLARADREQELSGWLGQRGVADVWAITPPLAAAGADLDWCARVATALDEESLGAGLAWVASTLDATSLLAQVQRSTRRISELVAAVRSYSQMDRASMQPVVVTEGLESTLVMLGHKIRPGVTVVREYDPDVSTFDAYAGELNQVWTNLIDNALDSIGDVGTLWLTTRREGDAVVVEVGDSGPGMSPAVADRAFEAFFTTKDVGSGTGLGLDIARRIVVERHGGQIGVDPRPDRFVLVVHLPLRHG